MTYLPDNPTLARRVELFAPAPFFREPTAMPLPPVRAGSRTGVWYTTLLFGSLSLGLLAWGILGTAPAPVNTEKNLRADAVASKLKGKALKQETATFPPMTVAETLPPAPVMPVAPEPMAQDLLSVPLPELEPPSVVPPALLPVEAPAPRILEQPDPPVFLGRAQRGETPMIRTWKTLALYSLIAMAPTPALAGGQEAKKQEAAEDQAKLIRDLVKWTETAGTALDGLKRDITKIQEEVTTLKGTRLTADVDAGKVATKIDSLERQLGYLQADVAFLKREMSKQAASGSGDKLGVEELRRQLIDIQQALARLNTSESTSKRIALSPPTNTARVVLTNTHYDSILFLVNQQMHRLAPGSSVVIESVPAGTVTYEAISPVFGVVQPPTNRTLAPNETLTVTAR